MTIWVDGLYLFAAVCFILALKGLASPNTARTGNALGIVGMLTAIITTLLLPPLHHMLTILILLVLGGAIGTTIALRIKMTAVPQLIAGFHSLVGLAAVLIAICVFLSPATFHINRPIPSTNLVEMILGLSIGAITFTGSIVAFLKLQDLLGSRAIRFYGQRPINALLALCMLGLMGWFIVQPTLPGLLLITTLATCLGVLLILPIGGADMPVVISLLNSYSGWATAGIGFTLNNTLLVITGALVGASGAILSYIMCTSMNRSILHVIFGSFEPTTLSSGQTIQPMKQANEEDAAFLLRHAKNVIIVPGYGMAVAHAQHAVKALMDALEPLSVRVRFAVHPVAGRMPGHMNVLLAEADIPYNKIFEQSQINHDFASTDVALVIGANDITNPAAKHNPDSPIYGMPILEVNRARTVLFIKRGLSPGYAGINNDLFSKENTRMVFGDAKDKVEAIVNALKTYH